MWHCVDKSYLWLYLLKNEFSKSKTFPAVGIQKIQQFRKFSLREYFYLSQASTGCLILNRQIISWCAGKVVLSPSAGLGRWDLLTGFQGRFTGLEVLGCAVEDEIGRPDPNEPDGDGRCQSQRTAVSNQVKSWNISFCQRPGAIARYGRTGSASPFPLQHHHHQETCQGIDLIILSII